MNSSSFFFENYQLTILDELENTAFVRLFPVKGEALKKERRKLYIVYHPNEVLYVGEAGSSLLKRFQGGCTAFNYKAKKGVNRRGYQGYKWLNKVENPIRTLSVFVLVFNEDFDKDRDFIQTIEAEVVYLIRHRTGDWPKFQNEIHFRNNKHASEIAVEVFANLLMKISFRPTFLEQNDQ